MAAERSRPDLPAAGGVGQIAVQIARIEGCRVVGIAGGPEKCAFVAGELGADAAIGKLLRVEMV